MSKRNQHRATNRSNDNYTKQRLIRYIEQNQHAEQSVIFDIGTRAVRILIGPKTVPTTSWERHHFFNDATLANLGTELDSNRNINPNSAGINKVISFINFYRPFLLKSNIPPENFLGFGTAVFRWLKNKEEIIQYIHHKTKLNIKILSAKEEARFSLYSIAATYNMRRFGDNVPTSNDDILLLLDQGGGSMEISYTSTNLAHIGLKSFDDLGAIALRERLFTRVKKGNLVNPNANKNRISVQHKRVLSYIDMKLHRWEGYPQLKGKRIHAYALGSTVSSLLRGSNYEIHNRLIKRQQLIERMQKDNRWIRQNNQYIATLYEEIQAEKSANKKPKYDEQLLLLCGLPVYSKVLKKFAIKNLRMCGYGLRYGVFVAQNRFNIKID